MKRDGHSLLLCFIRVDIILLMNTTFLSTGKTSSTETKTWQRICNVWRGTTRPRKGFLLQARMNITSNKSSIFYKKLDFNLCLILFGLITWIILHQNHIVAIKLLTIIEPQLSITIEKQKPNFWRRCFIHITWLSVS